MRGTEHFTRAITKYLSGCTATDPLFALNLMKPNKSIEEYVAYILNQVQASGCNSFEDSEIYSMAVHYYNEDEIKMGKAITRRVAVNHIVELTEKEKAETRQEAIKQYQHEELTKIQSRNARPQRKETAEVVQSSLFDS